MSTNISLFPAPPPLSCSCSSLKHVVLIAIVVYEEKNAALKNTDTVMSTVGERKVYTVKGEGGLVLHSLMGEGIVNI